MNRLLLVTAAPVAAVAVLAIVFLPPRRASLAARDDGTVPGSLHVHTIRSDGRSDADTIAAAASRAGLTFVVFTDHGDGTRPPDPPAYRNGVLCLDGVEISTNGGHYLAIGMPASPYPLGGEPGDVVEDVKRLGGFGVVAHADSPKDELRWREWDAPFDGIEVVNPDTAWRLLAQSPAWRPKLRLVEALLSYPLRPAETIINLADDVSETTAHWDRALETRKVVGLAGADAHAVLGWRDIDPRGRMSLPLPSYEASFRSLSTHVRLARPLTSDPAADADAIVDALRQGHAYVSVDGLASPASLVFTAENPQGKAEEGSTLAPGGAATLRVQSNAPPGFATTIRAGARIIATSRDGGASAVVPNALGAFRVEVHDERVADRLWLASNPIYIGAPASAARAERPPAVQTRALFDGVTLAGWRIETDPMSVGSLRMASDPDRPALQFTYRLAAVDTTGSLVGLVADVPESLAAFDRVTFSARSDHPVRVSIEFRTGGGGLDMRWTRSIYLDPVERQQTIFFDNVEPIGDAKGRQLPAADIRSILVVVDRSHTKGGATGTIWLSGAMLGG